jgi:DNA-binding IclR family transcriptional regulator
VALVQEDSTRTVVVTVREGSRLDITSAQMRVFLAYLPEPSVLERVTEGMSAAERAAIEAAVYSVRRTGYATVNLPDGLFAAAAPVFDEYGICATVALLGADQFAGFPPGSPQLTVLVETAAAISEELTAGREGARVADLR